MIEVTGRFRKYNNKVILFIDLESKEFQEIKEHIINNMFFAFRRIAPVFKSIILSSIGDHLDKSDNQDLNEAEVGIKVDILEPPTKDIIFLLDKHDYWYICCTHKDELFTFSIVKDSQFINNRDYTDAG